MEAVRNSPQPTLRISYTGNDDKREPLAYACRGNAAWEDLFEPTPDMRTAMADSGAAPSCVHPDDAHQYAAEATAALQRRQRQHISCARFVSGSGAIFSACEAAVFEYSARDGGRIREGAPAGGSTAVPLLRSVTLSYSHIRRLSGPSSPAGAVDSVAAAQPADAAPTAAMGASAKAVAAQLHALPVHTPLTAFDTPVARSASGGITLAAGDMAAFQARLAIAKYHALQATAAAAGASSAAVAAAVGTSEFASASASSPSSIASGPTVDADAGTAATAPASVRASTAGAPSSASPSSLSVQPSAPPSPLAARVASSAAAAAVTGAEPAGGQLSPLGQLLRARQGMPVGHSEPLPPPAESAATGGALAMGGLAGFGAYQQSMTSRLLAMPLPAHLSTGPRKLLSPSVLAPLQPSASSSSGSNSSGAAVADGSGRPAPRAFPPVPRMFTELTEGRSAWAAAAAAAHLQVAAADTEPAFKRFSGGLTGVGGGAGSSGSSSGLSGLAPLSAYGGYDHNIGMSLAASASAAAGAGAVAGSAGMHRVANLAATAALKASVAASVRLQLPSRDQWQRLADSSPFPALLRAADLPVPPPFVMRDSARHDDHDDDAAGSGGSSSAGAGAFAELLKQPQAQPKAADEKGSSSFGLAIALGSKRSRKDALGVAPSAAAAAMSLGMGLMGNHAAKHFAALPGLGLAHWQAADWRKGVVQGEPAILPGLSGPAGGSESESDSDAESHGYGGFTVGSFAQAEASTRSQGAAAPPSSCAAAVKSAGSAPSLSLHRPWSLLDLDI